MNFTRVLVCIAFLVVLTPFTSATSLGVNYYHESMMGSWGGTYYPVSTAQADKDFQDIKTISNHVKLYMNPLVSGNGVWVEQLSSLAKNRGLNVVVTMMVDDRKLTDSNWGSYQSSVVSYCSQLNGKVDGIIVANELKLNSYWDSWTIKDKVLNLISACKTKFSGEVSYQAFWYEKDAWKGYNGRIYFDLYENLGSFSTNLNEMNSNWGSNAVIGEWGEDLRDESITRDEQWQKEQVQKRWDLIKPTAAPIAYIFTYRETTYDGFGIVNGNTKRPAWYVFSSTSSPTTSTSSTASVILPPSGGCSTNTYGGTSVKTCDKGTFYEMYLLSYGGTKVCYQSVACVGKDSGYAKFSSSSATSTVSPPPPTTSGDSVASLPVSVKPSGTKSGDFMEGSSCRKVQFTTSYGWTEAKICDKGNNYEMYLLSPNNGASVCVNSNCVGPNSGFTSFS